ncbi:MAG TPA: pyrroline-5-carboxylate reductase dimerization domain-containing protein [Terriglobales bacterium]|jgi:competence protein ComER|nr:pyrroline-5-carboxylate reductase dimerization domain-containing protein [Terriglobales bacterium]
MNTGFVGIGSMGGMLVRALLRSRVLTDENVWAANRSEGKLKALAAEFPGIHVAGNRQLAANCDLIFLCLKAEDAAGVLAQMDPDLSPGQLLVTTASQIPLQTLEDRVPCRVAKLIPSITQEIGAGVALLMYGSRANADDHRLLEDLLGRISHPIVIAESQSRPAIGLASGGPAFVAYLLGSMAEEAAGSNPDFPPDLALSLVQETATATLRLMAEANMNPEEVIRRVALPGGRTALGIEVLSRHVPQAWQAVFRESAEREKTARETLAL